MGPPAADLVWACAKDSEFTATGGVRAVGAGFGRAAGPGGTAAMVSEACRAFAGPTGFGPDDTDEEGNAGISTRDSFGWRNLFTSADANKVPGKTC
jgi:hypothetical protein